MILPLLFAVLLSLAPFTQTQAQAVAPVTASPAQAVLPQSLSDFEKLAKAKMNAIVDREKKAKQEIKKKQQADKKSWDEGEKSRRQQFFKDNLSGPDRRAYVQEYKARQERFEIMQDAEKTATREYYAEEKSELKKKIEEKRKLIKKAIQTKSPITSDIVP